MSVSLLTTAKIANSAYNGQSIPEGWRALTADDLDMPTWEFLDFVYFQNRMYYHPALDPDPQAVALVNPAEKTIAIAFRGTENVNELAKLAIGQGDIADYGHISSLQGSYILNFEPLLKSVAKYQEAHPEYTNVLITGHSLGGAAVNQLESRGGEFGELYDNATYVAFASPLLSASPNVRNMGHENDFVYGRFDTLLARDIADYTSNDSDNMVYFNDEYRNDHLLGIDTSAHGMANYIDTINRVTTSGFYDLMKEDSTLIIDSTSGDAADINAPSVSLHSAPRFFIGEERADVIIGSSEVDYVEGKGGDDIIRAEDGNDILSGGWGFDLLDGGEGDDTADYSFYTQSDGLKIDLSSGSVNFRPEHSYGSPPLLEKLVGIENVNGGGGKDTLIGSMSNNTLFGGAGADVFVLSSGNDLIKDFEPGSGDVIQVPQGTDVQALQSSVTTDPNNNTMLTHAEGTLTLAGSWGPLTADYWFTVA